MNQKRPVKAFHQNQSITEQNEVDALFKESFSSYEISLENKCIQLLKRFQESADLQCFEGLFKPTAPLFTWFTSGAIKNTNSHLKQIDIINNAYASLFEYFLSPCTNIPSSGFINWSFTLIENVINAMNSGNSILKRSDLCPTDTEAHQRKVDLTRERLAAELMGEYINTDENDLLPLEREILSLFYRNRQEIKEIAASLNMDDQETIKLLRTSRSKILNRIAQKEPYLLWRGVLEGGCHD